MYNPDVLDSIGDDVVAMYERAELYLIRIIRDALLRLGEEPSWAVDQVLAIRQERHRIQGLMTVLQRRSPDAWAGVVDEAYMRGVLQAETELGELQQRGLFQAAPGSTVVNDAAVTAIASEGVTTMHKVHQNILRRTEDAWRGIVKDAAGFTTTGAMTPQQAVQRAFTRMARDGMGFYTDRAGRKWGLDTYANMAVRTATTRALLAGHTDTMLDRGIDLVVVSSHPRPAPVCAPYERKVLSLTGKFPRGTHRIGDNIVRVEATLREAEARGLHHPNAVLGGDQHLDTLAGSVGASKSAYRGPAITIVTAQGNRLTVSPEHPILTGRGWVTAESVRTSDHVFCTSPSDRVAADTLVGSHVDNVPTTAEDEFISLKTVGTNFRVPSAGYNFNDDRQFIEGEIDVVVTDDCLLPVPDTKIIKETGEVFFVRTDVSGVGEVCDSALAFGRGGVFGSVGRPLANLDTGSAQASLNGRSGRVEDGGDLLAGHSAGVHGDEPVHVDGLVQLVGGSDPSVTQSLAYRRVGDSSDPRDVGSAVSGGIQPENVVAVDRHSFAGHAYDFQTVDGVYAVNGIISHNCRHRHSAYVPGITRTTPSQPDPNHEGYKATQKQRRLEREIRASKRMEEAALTEQARMDARQRTRTYQAKLREHVAEHDLPRYRKREQLTKPGGIVAGNFDPPKRDADVLAMRRELGLED